MLEDIISRTNYISHHHPGKDLSLDIDLVKDDLRVLYRSFENLKNLAADREPLSPKAETPGEEAEARPGFIKKEPQDKLEVETEEPEKPEEPEEIQEIEEIEPKVVGTENKQKEAPVSNGKKSVIDLLSAYSQKTIGDQYAEADNSINKRISGDREDNSIGTKMQLNPISNIKEVIGLNEKFLFINELFVGNIQEYHDAIARLNAMENMQSAFDYLNELSEKYSWDAERSTATINKLATYVQRRHM